MILKKLQQINLENFLMNILKQKVSQMRMILNTKKRQKKLLKIKKYILMNSISSERIQYLLVKLENVHQSAIITNEELFWGLCVVIESELGVG